MTLDDLRNHRNAILKLAEQYGAANVRVFGSVARGEADQGSDVDILVDVTDVSKFTWAGGGLLMDLQDLLDCRVDLVTENGLNHLLRERILAEAVVL